MLLFIFGDDLGFSVCLLFDIHFFFSFQLLENGGGHVLVVESPVILLCSYWDRQMLKYAINLKGQASMKLK